MIPQNEHISPGPANSDCVYPKNARRNLASRVLSLRRLSEHPDISWGVVVTVIVLGLTFATRSAFLMETVFLVLIWAALASAWAVVERAGRVFLGPSVFTGISTYVVALLFTKSHLNPWLGSLAAMGGCVIVAVIIAGITARLRTYYFAVATLVVPLIGMSFVDYIGYPQVVVPVRPGNDWAYLQFADPRLYVYLALATLILLQALIWLVDQSRLGVRIRAIRQNEILARSVGVSIGWTQVTVLVVSAISTAWISTLWLNGALLTVASSQVFGIGVVVEILAVAYVGGVGSRWGPVLGAAVVIPLTQSLQRWVGSYLPGSDSLIYGACLMIVAIAIPGGLVTLPKRLHRRMHESTDEWPIEDGEICSHRIRRISYPMDAERDDSPILNVSAVSCNFGGVNVLTSINLVVSPGELIGVIGPNGAGKTTLMNIISGHVSSVGGAMYCGNVLIDRLSLGNRFSLGIRRTFQVTLGFPELSALENIYVAALGGAIQDPHGEAVRLLDWVGLSSVSSRSPAGLTTFQLKLLELARACVGAPKVILLDEPLAGLNKSESHKVLELLRELTSSGIAVLIVDHSVHWLTSFCNRMIVLVDGSVIADGVPDEVMHLPGVVSAYLGRDGSEKSDA